MKKIQRQILLEWEEVVGIFKKIKKVKISIIILLLSPLYLSCHSFKKNKQKRYDYINIEEIIILEDTLTMMVLAYRPAIECDEVIHWHSTCFGLNIKTDEIFMVLSECNYDSTISRGDFVRVTNKERTKFREGRVPIMVKEYRDNKYSPLYKLQAQIVYGSLEKLK